MHCHAQTQTISIPYLSHPSQIFWPPESCYANASQNIATPRYHFTPPPQPWYSPDTRGYRISYATGEKHTVHGNPTTHLRVPVNNSSSVIQPMYTLLPDQHFLQYSGRSTFFPPEKQLRQSLVQAIHRWRKQHHLPIPQQDDATIQQFVSQQMTLHQQHQQQTLNLHIVKNATRHIPTGIVHCEDHFPNRLMWCCPTIYSDAISATFLDESVFHQLHIRPLTHHLNTYNNIAKLLPQYKWALKEWGRVPTANIDPPQGQKAVCQGQAHRLLYGSHDASSHP